MFIMNKCAFESHFGGQNETLLNILDMKISCLNHPIKKTIINQIIPHWFSDDDINMLIKIFKKHDINNIIPLILFNYFLHHEPILDFDFPMSIDGTDYFFRPHFSSVDRVQAITPSGEM